MVENERDLIILACALSSVGAPSERRAGGKERPIDDVVMTGYSFYRLAAAVEGKGWLFNIIGLEGAESRSWTDETNLVAALGEHSAQWKDPVIVHFGGRTEFYGRLRARALALSVTLPWLWRLSARDAWPEVDAHELDLRHRLFSDIGEHGYNLTRAADLIRVPLADHLRVHAALGARVEAELKATAAFALFIRLCRQEGIMELQPACLLLSQLVEITTELSSSKPYLADLIRDFE
jgi:hypothetical protein